MFSRAFVRGVACSRISFAQRRALTAPPLASRPAAASVTRPSRAILSGFRGYSSGSGERTADEIVEELQELYATAKDEFEIAQEETEKVSVYAEDDRGAAREELDKLEAAFKAAVEDSSSEISQEVQRRVGHRIRELANAVNNMEEMAQNQD